MKKLFVSAAIAALSTATATATTTRAHAEPPIIFDKIAAIVDDVVLYRSDVVERAKPHLQRLTDPSGKAVGAKEIYKGMLDRMIDEQLFSAEARRLHITAEDSDVDSGLKMITESTKLSREQLEAEVKKQGLSWEQYRQEIRRQIVEGKWIRLRIAGKKIDVKTSPGNTDAEREKSYNETLERERKAGLKELRAKAFVEVRL